MSGFGTGARLLATTSALALLSCGAAFAQTATPAAPAANTATDISGNQVDAIVVTGTRLQATGFTTPTPVTVVGQQALQESAPGAILDSLVQLPAFRNSSSTTSGARGAGGVGQNVADLRGLGSTRTLTLLDGRRIVGFSANSVVDTNIIPVGLVQRVEVVTGGASAAYGSDAVSGVVNFILNSRLEGVQGDYHYGISQAGDNIENSLSLAAGHAFLDGKLHVIFGLDAFKNDGTGTLYSRDWGRREPGVLGLPATRTAGLPANVLTSGVEYGSYTTGGLITSGPLKGTAFGPSGSLYNMNYGLVGGTVMAGAGSNYGSSVQDLQPLKIPIKRLSTMVRAEYEVAPNITAYGELGLATSSADSHTFTYLSSSVISANNPYLPAALATQMAANKLSTVTIGRENMEYGGINSQPVEQLYRGVLGLKGTVFGDWTWDLSWQHGESRYAYKPYNQVLTANYNAAIYAVRDPVSGQIVCGPSATNPNLTAASAALVKPGCVPFNPFGAGAPSQAALNYTGESYLDWRVDHRKEDSVDFTLAGKPFSLWAGPVDVAVGAEYRNDDYHQISSAESQARLFSVGNQPTFGGSQEVKEGFGEIGVPLAKDLPLIKSLAFNGAVRETDYSTSGKVTTWKAGGTYEPDDVFRFRATWSRDIRAPNISELFSPGSGGTCPSCRGVNNTTGFVTTISPGNPNLQPEIASTFTGGVVFQPKWGFTNGFRASVDYYNIRINGVIASVAVQDIIDRCLRQNLQQYCSQITFDSTAAAGISQVNLAPLNLNQLRSEGVDFEMSYRVPTDALGIPGALNLRALGSYAKHLTTITAITGGGVQSIDQAGGSVPKWRWTFDAQYMVGPWTGGVMVRTQSTLHYDINLIGPDNPAYNPALSNSINDNLFPKVMYIDLNTSYDLKVFGGRQLQVYGLVQNLMNQDPPLGYTFVGAGSGNGVYDEIGRTYKVGFRFKY